MRNARQHNIEINSLHSPAPERIIRIAVQEAIYEINEKLLKSIIQMYVIVMPDYSNCKMRHTPASDNTKKKFFFSSQYSQYIYSTSFVGLFNAYFYTLLKHVIHSIHVSLFYRLWLKINLLIKIHKTVVYKEKSDKKFCCLSVAQFAWSSEWMFRNSHGLCSLRIFLFELVLLCFKIH